MTARQIPPLYDRIGNGYPAGRREDPRIAARLWAALGDASSVVNVGTGSYEPSDRHVVAVEPSSVMLAQRPPATAPSVRAVPEALPFADGAFDAAMAVLTLHRWSDKALGLAEMRRVARGPVVLFMADRALITSWWLHRCFPAAAALVADRYRIAGFRQTAPSGASDWAHFRKSAVYRRRLTVGRLASNDLQPRLDPRDEARRRGRKDARQGPPSRGLPPAAGPRRGLHHTPAPNPLPQPDRRPGHRDAARRFAPRARPATPGV